MFLLALVLHRLGHCRLELELALNEQIGPETNWNVLYPGYMVPAQEEPGHMVDLPKVSGPGTRNHV